MKSKLIYVTPEIARQWLRFNTHNRALRRTLVDALKLAFARGEYVPTHQGVAFSRDGALLDGQHRLTAISELKSGSFPMLVTEDVPSEAYKVMDIGAKRTTADSLRYDDRRLVECARFLASVYEGKRLVITPTYAMQFITAITEAHNNLSNFCCTPTKVWSAAPIRAAAVISLMAGNDEDYVKLTYKQMVNGDLRNMPPIAYALNQAYSNGTFNPRDRLDTFSRAFQVFNPQKANLKRAFPAPEAVQVTRNILMAELANTSRQKKATPKKGVAADVSVFNSIKKVLKKEATGVH